MENGNNVHGLLSQAVDDQVGEYRPEPQLIPWGKVRAAMPLTRSQRNGAAGRNNRADDITCGTRAPLLKDVVPNFPQVGCSFRRQNVTAHQAGCLRSSSS